MRNGIFFGILNKMDTEDKPCSEGDSCCCLDRRTLPLKVFRNPNYFMPDEQRANEYLHLDRSSTTFHPNFSIPIGDGYVRYKGYEFGGVNDRPLASYQAMLFPDDFEVIRPPDTGSPKGWTAEYMLREGMRKEHPEKIFGGYDEVLRSGRTVLDLGSGQALALMQLALKFSQTSFIGLDILYQQELPVFPGKPGLQLTRGDWRFLEPIPDRSIDTLLSCQGIGMWGLPGGPGEANEEDGRKVIRALERVARPGAVLRMDCVGNFLENNLDRERWEMIRYGRAVIAKSRY